MKKILIGILFILNTFASAETKIEELLQHEIRTYSPEIAGVKDLIFEARIDGLPDILAKNSAIGKRNDIYFKIYWKTPNQYRIEVEGLPGNAASFKEIKDDLRELIKGKLEFVIPEKMSDKLKSYSLKIEPITDGKLLKAIDETYTLSIPEIDIVFDKTGKLKSMESRAPMSAVKTEFNNSPKSWSNNKLVLDKVVSVSGSPGNSFSVVNEIQYVDVNGFGFPSQINVKNIVEFMGSNKEKEKPKLMKKETTSVIRFSKYEINTGRAAKFIDEGAFK